MSAIAHIGDRTVPFNGAGGGSNPPPGSFPRLRLLVEGWRFLPHSYSIVNQQQCLALLKRQDVVLWHRDVPILPQLGEPVMDVLPSRDEDLMSLIPEPHREAPLDAVYRIGYPHDFGPSCCGAATFVFATCERGMLKDVDVLKPPLSGGRLARKFQDRIRDNNITIITPSEWSRRGFIRSGVDPDRIVVVPHGVDASVFCPMDKDERDSQRKSRKQEGTFTFLHVSAMTGNKNVEGLIRAFLAVVRKYPHARLVLKGLSRMFHSDKWLSQEFGRLSNDERALAHKTIYYIGVPLKQADQAMLYQLADAYVAPYQSEGFNIPVLEAAACGLPVITTAGGPTDEFTTPEFCLPVKAALGDHHHDGSIWFDTDQKSLEDQMDRAITDHAWRERANIAGPEHVKSYSWEKVVGRLLDVIHSKVPLKGNRQ